MTPHRAHRAQPTHRSCGHSSRNRNHNRGLQSGQSSVEYVVICTAIAFALFIDPRTDQSVITDLLAAFARAYQNISFALSLPQ